MLLALLPLQVVALSVTAPPVEVTLHDANHKETFVVTIARDGTVDDATRELLEYKFRCRRSGKEKPLNKGLLAMLADVQARWPGHTIEYVSAYRGWRGERRTSPHRAARAFDFRIPGVKLTEVRDYLWTHFRGVGVGWYPHEGFVHMDYRPDKGDTAWTSTRGRERYRPSWALRLRDPHEERRAARTRESRVGL